MFAWLPYLSAGSSYPSIYLPLCLSTYWLSIYPNPSPVAGHTRTTAFWHKCAHHQRSQREKTQTWSRQAQYQKCRRQGDCWYEVDTQSSSIQGSYLKTWSRWLKPNHPHLFLEVVVHVRTIREVCSMGCDSVNASTLCWLFRRLLVSDTFLPDGSWASIWAFACFCLRTENRARETRIFDDRGGVGWGGARCYRHVNICTSLMLRYWDLL